ncbi:MAG: hypothetical protein WBR26_05570 [Candidatus Acidiferrum sp.]
MLGEDRQVLAVGDSVVFEDAYTSETKYGRVERGYGSTFIVHIVPREEAGPSPKPLRVRRPCKLVSEPNGVRMCGSHQTELVECDLQSEENPSGLGHLRAWACPVSGKQFVEADGM